MAPGEMNDGEAQAFTRAPLTGVGVDKPPVRRSQLDGLRSADRKAYPNEAQRALSRRVPLAREIFVSRRRPPRAWSVWATSGRLGLARPNRCLYKPGSAPFPTPLEAGRDSSRDM